MSEVKRDATVSELVSSRANWRSNRTSKKARDRLEAAECAVEARAAIAKAKGE